MTHRQFPSAPATQRYYPPARRTLLGPAAFALLVGLPFLVKPDKATIGIAILVVAFSLAFLGWRRLFRVELSERSIVGRDPETARWTELQLSAIVAVRETEFAIGRIKGWVFVSAGGHAVFVNEGALQNPVIRALVDQRDGPVRPL